MVNARRHTTFKTHMRTWSSEPEPEPEPPEPVHFARSRSRSRRTVLLGVGAGAEMLPRSRSWSRSWSRSRPKMSRLRIPGVNIWFPVHFAIHPNPCVMCFGALYKFEANDFWRTSTCLKGFIWGQNREKGKMDMVYFWGYEIYARVQ